MFQNPYLNQNHIYSEFKTKFIIVWNSKQKSKTSPSSFFLLFSHELQQQNHKTSNNPKFKNPPIPFPIFCHEY
jgi:hypothetical protein